MSIIMAIIVLVVLTVIVATIQGRRCAPPVVEPEPVYVDECETCRRPLTADEVHELRSNADDEIEREIVAKAGGFGGSYMSATYCAEHYPPNLLDTPPSVAGDVES